MSGTVVVVVVLYYYLIRLELSSFSAIQPNYLIESLNKFS